MKCPNCGQTLTDNKDFCPNCGKRLREAKRGDIKPITAVIIIILLLAVGVAICLCIMFVGTKKELEPYLKNKDKVIENTQSKLNIEEYYGEYKIKDITRIETNFDSTVDSNTVTGKEVIFNKNEIKFSIGNDSYDIPNPNFSIEEEANFKNHFKSSDEQKLYGVYVSGKNTITNEMITLNFVIFNNYLYLYHKDYLYAL